MITGYRKEYIILFDKCQQKEEKIRRIKYTKMKIRGGVHLFSVHNLFTYADKQRIKPVSHVAETDSGRQIKTKNTDESDQWLAAEDRKFIRVFCIPSIYKTIYNMKIKTANRLIPPPVQTGQVKEDLHE